MVWVLVGGGKRLEVGEDGRGEEGRRRREIRIGKSEANELVIGHESVSRSHAVMGYDERKQAVWVEDASSNGTWVNGEKMETGRRIELKSGSKIKFGEDQEVYVLELVDRSQGTKELLSSLEGYGDEGLTSDKHQLQDLALGVGDLGRRTREILLLQVEVLDPGIGRDLGLGTGDDLAPGTGDDLAPGTGDDLGPGTGDDLAPGTGDDLAPGTGDDLAPGTGGGRNHEIAGLSLAEEGDPDREVQGKEERMRQRIILQQETCMIAQGTFKGTLEQEQIYNF
eukprot:768377-Hanusia_phi.AAC.7